MQRASTTISRVLFGFIIMVIIAKSLSTSGMFEPKDHKGKGYAVKIPEGWKKVKKDKDVVYPEGVEVAMFVPKEIDTRRELPDIYISIFTKKLNTPIWIEDEFPEILRGLHASGYKIMDKGKIDMDEVFSQWVVYHDQKASALVLEFYMVTDNNIFYKIQYAAPPDEFNKRRPSFEELRESFKFRFTLY